MVLTKADYARQPAEEWQAAARWFNGLRQVVQTACSMGFMSGE